MVRTLDFHSNNVGSIPASLTYMISQYFKSNIFFFKTKKNIVLTPKKRYLKYNLRFASIIAPGSINNLRLMQLGTKAPQKPHNKLIVKQTYLLLTWLTYIKTSSGSTSKTPAFFIQPKKQIKFTHLKAPMAHKTFSQEQFIFRHYIITISFKTLISKNIKINTLNDSIFLILSIRNSIPFFNTNLLFLKRINFSFSSTDYNYFKLF